MNRAELLASWLSESGRRNLLALPSEGWATVAEMKPAATGSGMDLLYVRTNRGEQLCDRRWARWGGEPGQKRGEGYEYSITALGEEVRQIVRARAATIGAEHE